jgi:hypothetical protein
MSNALDLHKKVCDCKYQLNAIWTLLDNYKFKNVNKFYFIQQAGLKIFRTTPHWLWGLRGLLYNGYRVSFLGIKQPRLGVDYPLPSITV